MKNRNVVFKNGFLSIMIGGSASIIFFLIYRLVNPDFPFEFKEVIGIILLVAIVSGSVSIGSSYIDSLLFRYGMKNNILRMIIMFLCVFIFVSGLSFFLIEILDTDFTYFEPILLLIGIGGFILAIMAIFIISSIWKMKEKVLALEIENRYLEEMTRKEKILEETTKQLIVSQERNRIARELHDSISQGLNGIKYMIYSTKNKIDKKEYAKVIEIINEVEETTEETLKELRNMIFALKPSSLKEHGLSKAIKIQCELFSKRQGVHVVYDIKEISSLSIEQEISLYRVVQEAFTNIQKHSKATEVSISLVESQKRVYLKIQDNGIGFSKETKKGIGLTNMKTRIIQNNGSIKIDSKENNGTIIEATLESLN